MVRGMALALVEEEGLRVRICVQQGSISLLLNQYSYFCTN